MHCKISKPRGKTLHGLQTLVVYDIVLDPTTTIDCREIPGSLSRFLDPFFGLTWSSGVHVTESLELSGLSRQGQKDRKRLPWPPASRTSARLFLSSFARKCSQNSKM